MGLDLFVYDREGGNLLIHRYVGNIAFVSAARKDLGPVLDPNSSVIFRKVIFNAVHTGDAIPISDFPQLEAELCQIKEAEVQSEFVSDFVEVMEEVLKVAKANNRPLEF